MGISIRVSHWLNEFGHDTIHLSDQKLHELSDEDVIKKAVKEDRIILTADMDFGHLLATNKSRLVSVIQFRVTDFRADNIIVKLPFVLEQIANSTSKFIITVEDKRIRYRELPI